jgi:hypothetical protein
MSNFCHVKAKIETRKTGLRTVDTLPQTTCSHISFFVVGMP